MICFTKELKKWRHVIRDNTDENQGFRSVNMGIKDYVMKIKEGFVVRKVQKMDFPAFHDKDICRKSIVFEGKVQQVGFRFEAQLIAENLELTGKAVNQIDGSVLVELQGSAQKIEHLILRMHQINRIKIEKYTVKEIPIVENEKSFVSEY